MPRRIRKGPRRRTTKSAGVVALKKVNKVIRMQEKKFIDTSGSANQSSTVLITPLSLAGQGDTASSREGSKISMSSIQMKYTWKMSEGATSTRARIMLIQDKQVNGASFSANDLLESSALGTAIISPLNLDGAFRFRVLYNKVHTLSGEGSKVQYKEMFKKININARYSGSGGTISQVLSSGLFLLAVTDETSQTPNLSFFVRIRFNDS